MEIANDMKSTNPCERLGSQKIMNRCLYGAKQFTKGTFLQTSLIWKRKVRIRLSSVARMKVEMLKIGSM
jgi:hypothetical protein